MLKSVLGLLIAGLFASDTGLALVIDPLGIKIEANAGEQTTGTISITNENQASIKLNIDVRDLSSPFRQPESWISLESTRFQLAPGESTQLGYTVSVPGNASGQLLAKLGFHEDPADKSATVGVQTMVSIYLAAIVKGTERYGAEILSIRGHPTKPTLLEIVVKNTGNVYIKPTGNCIIRALGTPDTPIAVTLNDPSRSLFPDRLTTITGRLEKPLKAGTYSAEISIPLPETTTPVTKIFDLKIEPATDAK